MLLATLILLQLAPTITGRVVDAETGAPLPGATVQLHGTAQGAVAGSDGHFAIHRVASGGYTLEARFVGYEPLIRQVEAPGQGLTLELQRSALETGEVIVTGSPLGTVARYQPAQRLNREDLQRRSASSLGEALDGSPGVSMRSLGPAPARPVVRGFDGDRLIVLEDGQRSGDLSETAADHAIALDPLAADRVEIVRGPASLLYGSGAIGGVVNVITDDLPTSWANGVSGDAVLQSSTVNRQGAAYARLRYGAPGWAVGGRLAARGAGDLRTPEGVLFGTALRNVDAGASAVALYRGWTTGLAVSGLVRTYGLPEGLDDPQERVEIRMDRQMLQARARRAGTGLMEGLELRIHAGRYAHDEVEIAAEGEDLELRFEQRSISATLVAQHGALGPIRQGAVGLNVFVRDLQVGGSEVLTPDGAAWTAAGFVFEELPLGALVTVQTAFRAELQGMRVRPNALFEDASDVHRTFAVSGALGLNAQPAPGVEVGLQVAQAYRVPTIEERYSDAPHVGAGAYEIGNPDLGIERSMGADAFVRLNAGAASAEVAAFVTRIRDFVVYQPTGEIEPHSGLPVHIYEPDEALQLGYELRAAVALVSWLRLDFGSDYVHATRTRTSEPLPRIPPLRGLLGLAADVGSMWGSVSLRAIASQRRTAPNEVASAGYALLGIDAGVRLGADRQHVVAVRIDNLLDVAYRDHLSRVETRHAAMPGRNLNLSYRIMW